MARALTSVQCDSIATYVDEMQVKIAEAYQPPRKVTLPAAYYNKLPDVSKFTYDFTLEKTVLEKMKEWRKIRTSYSEARSARLEEKRKKESEKSPPSSPSPDTAPLPIKVALAPEATILTPQPLFSPANDIQNHRKVNGLDCSLLSFDNDTSSPFDNMELETINEMEELAQVLQPTTSQWAPASSLEGVMNDLKMEQRVENEMKKEEAVKKDYEEFDESTINKHTDPKQRQVLSIVEELQKVLDQSNMEKQQPWPNLETPVTENNSRKSTENASIDQKELARTLADLSIDDQKLAKRLSDMGFSLSRVARAIRDLEGQDNKKIVEYLLAIQSLEELGISEDAAVKALALTHYDQHKAKVYYESLCTLKNLGFPEDKASMALLKCNIDRDSALDLLIA